MTDKLDPGVALLVQSDLLRERLDTNPAVAFLAGFSGESLRTMQQSLCVVAGLFTEASGRSCAIDLTQAALDIPWGSLQRSHVKRIRELLSERFAPNTARRHFTALRGVLVEAGSSAAVGVKPPKGTSPDAGRALSRQEIDQLLEGPSPTYRGFELRALIAVTYAAGLRRFEVAALDVGDFDGDVITVRRGKGKKFRQIKLAPRAAKALRDWIEVRGCDPGALFFGRKIGVRISGSTVDHRLKRCALDVGVAKFSPHDLRRTFVTRILEKTGDLLIAQRLAGHANVETTRRYDKRGQSVLDAASVALDD